MSLQEEINTAIKNAMKSKDQTALSALRAVKSELLLISTQAGDKSISEEEELKLLQKMVKQRKESAAIYQEKERNDLAEAELAQVEVLNAFLPKQLSYEEIENVIKDIIDQMGITGIQEMGKVMGIATKELAGKADGKTISEVVKNILSK